MKWWLGLLAFGGWALAASDTSSASEGSAVQELLAQLSPCANQCLADTVPASGCNLTDTACVCTNVALAQSIEVCLLTNCTVMQALETKRIQGTMCGVPVRSQQGHIKRVAWALWVLTLLAVAGRFAARSSYFDGAGYGWDDWLILVTEVLVTAIVIIGWLMLQSGLGKDMWELRHDGISSVLMYFWIEEMLYSWAVQLTKVSIILFYLRIFPTTVSNLFRRGCFVMIGVSITTAAAFSLATLFQCSPVSYAWTLWDGQHRGRCFNTCTNTLGSAYYLSDFALDGAERAVSDTAWQLAEIYAGSGVNTIEDLIVFAMPIPKLMKVQLNKRKKVGILMTFAVGLFVTTCSIIRLAYVVRWRKTTNPTWSYAPIAEWSLIECDIGVVCACMPSLAGPIKRFWVMAVGQHISHLYESRSRAKTPTAGEVTSSKSGGNAWSRVSRTGDSKPSENSIMRDVSLHVSDEVELVDKSSGMSKSPAESSVHGYRQKW